MVNRNHSKLKYQKNKRNPKNSPKTPNVKTKDLSQTTTEKGISQSTISSTETSSTTPSFTSVITPFVQIPSKFLPLYEKSRNLYELRTEKEKSSASKSLKRNPFLNKASAEEEEQPIEGDFENSKKFQKKDTRFYQTLAKSGTSSDKTAALTILFQENPYELGILDTLLNLAKKKGRREAEMAISSLKEIFLTSLLEEREFKFFHEQPNLDESKINNDRLIEYYYEDAVKQRYKQFLKILELGTHDNLPHFKQFCIRILGELIYNKPFEQMKLLIGILVNKFGDPDKKIGSKVSHVLAVGVNKHGELTKPLAQELELLIARPNLSINSQHHAAALLNQLTFVRGETEIPNRIVLLYFSIFKSIRKEGLEQNKLLSLILTGIARAVPFSCLPEDLFNENLDSLYKLSHQSTFNKAVQALLVIQQSYFLRGEQIILTNNNNNNNNNNKRKTKPTETQGKKQAASTEQNSVCPLPPRFYRVLYEKLFCPEVLTTSRIALLFHLLYKSMKADLDIKRLQAFAKRLLQLCTYHKPSFVCASLLLFSEVAKLKPGLWSLLLVPEKNKVNSKSNKNSQTPSQKDDDFWDPTQLGQEDSNEKKILDEDEDEGKKKEKPIELYDPKKRQPEFCRAETSCLWEILLLQNHFHPSVVKFATTLLNGYSINYRSNPLNDFSFSAFLDRFSFKNPKEKERTHRKPIARSSRLPPVNKEGFLKQKFIPDEEVFFYKYFKQKDQIAQEKAKKLKKKKKSDESDDEAQDDPNSIHFHGESDDDESEGESSDFDEEDDDEDEDEDEYQDEQDEEVEQDEKEEDDENVEKESESESESDEDDQEFSYDDLEDGDDEEDSTVTSAGTSAKVPSEKELEKVLLENLSSDDEDLFGSSEKNKKKMLGKNKRAKKEFGESSDEEKDDFEETEGHEQLRDKYLDKKGKLKKGISTFADAEEFAQILENSGNKYGKNIKQRQWEKRKSAGNKKKESRTKQNPSDKNKRKSSKQPKNPNKRRKF